jgi:predicted enzyme related to lactoylglutathione lyase
MKPTLKNAWGYQDDAMNLPVEDIEAAAQFYECVMQFQVESRSDEPHKKIVLE